MKKFIEKNLQNLTVAYEEATNTKLQSTKKVLCLKEYLKAKNSDFISELNKISAKTLYQKYNEGHRLYVYDNTLYLGKFSEEGNFDYNSAEIIAELLENNTEERFFHIVKNIGEIWKNVVESYEGSTSGSLGSDFSYTSIDGHVNKSTREIVCNGSSTTYNYNNADVAKIVNDIIQKGYYIKEEYEENNWEGQDSYTHKSITYCHIPKNI